MNNTLLPDTLNEWVNLLVQISVVAIAVGGFVWKTIREPIQKDLNGRGTRVTANEMQLVALDTRIDQGARDMDKSQFDRAAIHERMGKLELMFEKSMLEWRDNRERLVRIETLLDDKKR